MRVWEVTLKEFDGSTDETDNLVLWIASLAPPIPVEGSVVESVTLLPDLDEYTPGVDLIIGR